MTTFCNPYGSENPGGHAVNNLAAFEPVPAVVRDQWNCDRRDTHRFRWVCEHGHRGGQVVSLCPKHWAELNGERTYPDTGQAVPYPVRRDVGFCPRCNAESDHRCRVRLEHVS